MRKSLLFAVCLIGVGLFVAQATDPTGEGTPDAPRATAIAQPAVTATPRVRQQLPRAPDRLDASGGVGASANDVLAVTLNKDNKVALVDPLAGRVMRTLDVGMPPGAITPTPDGRTAWVFSSKAGVGTVETLDLLGGSKGDERHFNDGDGPAAVAFSTDGSRAYVAMDGDLTSPPAPSTVAFVNTTGGEIGRITLGRQSRGVQIRRQLSSVAVSPGPHGDVVYAAARNSGAVWALDGGSGAELRELEVGGGPLGIITNNARHRVYVLLDTTNQLATIDTTTQDIRSRIDLPGSPAGAVVGTDGTLYVVGSAASGEIWVIGADDNKVQRRVPMGGAPTAVAISSDGKRLYITDRSSAALEVVQIATWRLSGWIPLGTEPVGLATARRAGASPKQTPTPLPRGTPTPTPAIVAPPTPVPDGTGLPEHVPANVVGDAFMSGADSPVALAFAPDGRLFYNELHTGKIRVVQNGTLLPDPFYQFVVSGEPEAGLISILLDPHFAENHYVYAFYTSVPDGQENGGPNGPNEVVRLTEVDNKGTHLTPILRDLPSGPIHNSGTLRFGPDGKLYVALGDNDQGGNAQNLGSLAGKILRVNPDGSVPDDNPFVGQSGAQPAIWAYGLRNPFSFAFHPTGRTAIAVENGPGDNDELDVISRGANYGWPPTGYKYATGVTDPIAVFNPPIGPTGSTFYVGDQVRDWKNDWFYCNYHQGQLRRVRLAPGSYDRIVFEEVVKAGCLFDVATGPDGALYYSDPKGIYRLHAQGAHLLPAVKSVPVPASATEVLPANTRAEDRDVGITLSEWKMQPSRSTVPAGSISLLGENVGATQHALRVVGNGLDVSTEKFGTGQSRTLVLALQPGTYQLSCPVPGHVQQGMQTTLTVVGQ